MKEQAPIKMEVNKFRLEKRDVTTGEVFEIIEGDSEGITHIWNKEQDNGTN